MARKRGPSLSGVPSDGYKDVMLLRFGARFAVDDISTSARGPSLRRLVGGQDHNVRGASLAYAPHSFRCHVEHVPRWVRHCRSMLHDRRGRQNSEDKQQVLIAMGFFALIVLRRWKKWARREAGLRRLFEKLSAGDALRSWKKAARFGAFQATMQRLATRGALQRWKRELDRRAAFEAAAQHSSRKLVSKVWKAWVIRRSDAAFDHHRLREAIGRWRAWQLWWKTRLDCFYKLVTRRALASTVSRWHLEASARHGRRQEAVHLLGSLLLRRCLLALADNAHSAAILRRLLDRCRMRALRGGLWAWKRWFLVSSEDQETLKANAAAAGRDGDAYNATSKRRDRLHPGKPRKVHCRCVYAVCRGQRCTCAPSSHLLRRVEELHRLVAKGLDGRNGGYRLLSHVVQGTEAPLVGRLRSITQPSSAQQSVSGGRYGKANCCDNPPGDTASPRAQQLGGGAGSDESPQAGTCKRGSLSVVEGTESYPASGAAEFGRGSAGQHARLVEAEIDVLAGAFSSSIITSRPRCEDRGLRRRAAPRRGQNMTRW